jgi:hypothetical protein
LAEEFDDELLPDYGSILTDLEIKQGRKCQIRLPSNNLDILSVIPEQRDDSFFKMIQFHGQLRVMMRETIIVILRHMWFDFRFESHTWIMASATSTWRWLTHVEIALAIDYAHALI